jgi:hypothetical protein
MPHPSYQVRYEVEDRNQNMMDAVLVAAIPNKP